MRQRSLIGLILATVVTASSCATIMDGESQTVTFNSNPNEVEIFMDGKRLGVTPLTLQIKREQNKMFIAKKEGYEEQQMVMSTRLNSWFWGNFITGGALGSTTDFASGAAHEYSPNNYYVTLTPQKASESLRNQLEREMWARNFILGSYWHLADDIARSRGEYLLSLYTILGIETSQQEEVRRNLGNLLSKSHNIPVFAESVVDRYFVQ
ncbi:MAG: PEGA domain-containing protein [Nitrospira sp.]|nr:PEGA domain-containing protein [Nitrospira sp.]